MWTHIQGSQFTSEVQMITMCGQSEHRDHGESTVTTSNGGPFHEAGAEAYCASLI